MTELVANHPMGALLAFLIAALLIGHCATQLRKAVTPATAREAELQAQIDILEAEAERREGDDNDE